MSLFNWNSSYSVKIPSIDQQHKKLVDLINELHDSMKSGKGSEAMGGILLDLINYTKTHFKFEEDMLKRNGYEKLGDQQRAHAMFVSKIEDTKRDLDSGKPVFSMKMMNFLKDWLKSHILKTDMEYSEFLVSKGEK